MYSTHIQTPDARIYVPVNYAGDTPARRVVVMCHGLTGNPHEAVHEIARRHLNAVGYDVVRPAFYWYGDDLRQMHETTLETHVSDVKAVVEWIVGVWGADVEVFLVGHSYGGTTLLKACFGAPVVAQVLWDTYADMATYWRNGVERMGDLWVMDKRIQMVAGEAQIAEGQAVTLEQAAVWAGESKVPTLQVVAEYGGSLERGAEALFAALPEPKKYVLLENCGHTFVENDAAERLIYVTLEWFNRFGKKEK